LAEPVNHKTISQTQTAASSRSQTKALREVKINLKKIKSNMASRLNSLKPQADGISESSRSRILTKKLFSNRIKKNNGMRVSNQLRNSTSCGQSRRDVAKKHKGMLSTSYDFIYGTKFHEFDDEKDRFWSNHALEFSSFNTTHSEKFR